MNLRYALGTAAAVHIMAGLYVWATYTPVRPLLECVEQEGDHYVAHFGWTLKATEPYKVPVGPENRLITPGINEDDFGQPTTFLPGRTPKYPKTVFRVKFDGVLTWELGNREVTAAWLSPRCELPDQQKAVRELELVKVKPPPKKEKPPPPKKVDPPPPKLEVATVEVKAKRRQIRKRGQPKRKKKLKKKEPPKTPPKTEPVPVTLTNVGLTGGINVQKGERDNYGDPSVKATKSNSRQRHGNKTQSGNEVGGGKGDVAKQRPPKIVSPKVLRRPKVKWPANAPLLGRVVTVRLSLSVGRDGRVKKVKIIKGAGKVFNKAAISVAKRITFKPGTRDGKPIALPVPWTVVFQPAS